MKTPQYIFVHHTAVSYTKNPDQWKATDNFHRSKDWGGGGYNYEVAKDGSIHQFREDGAVTTAQYQKKMNDGRALSICLDMDGDIEVPTPEQKEAVAKFLREKMAKYNIPKENVFCHRAVADYKSCPGKLLPDNIYSYFITPMAGTPQQPVILDWAKESVEWASNNGLITVISLSETQQWVLVILYRFWKTFLNKTP